MVFSGLPFLFFYLTATLLIYKLTPLKLRNLMLLIASLLFYGWGEPVYIVIMFLSTAVDYTHGMLVERWRDNDRKARMAVASSVFFNLLILVTFKYYDFLAGSLNAITGWNLPLLGVPMPIGISFYTFQTMSYTIDVYRKDAPVQRNIVTFGTFVTLFPQLIAGPIIQYKSVADQLKSRREDLEKFVSGVQRFCVGLAKKVLLANAVGKLWDVFLATDTAELTVVGAWLGLVAYAFQIYFDFSGYSDMAVGLGRMFGFEFIENFNYPYISKSVVEFWKRWHISLTNWFREYVYFPLGGNRVSKPKWIRHLARSGVELPPLGPLLRPLHAGGAAVLGEGPCKAPRPGAAFLRHGGGAGGLGPLRHRGHGPAGALPEGVLWRRRPGGRLHPPPALELPAPAGDFDLCRPACRPEVVLPPAGACAGGGDPGAGAGGHGAVHRLPGGRQLQPLPLFPLLRRCLNRE